MRRAITFNAGISAITAGVQAISSSTGSMTVTGSGNIGGTDHAITVVNTAATKSGDLTVNTSGNYTGGIRAQVTQGGNDANISVTHTGTLSNASTLITATTAGNGNVAVTTTQALNSGSTSIITQTAAGGITIATGAVTSTSGDAIDATVTSGGTRGISITTNGTVNANLIGINAAVPQSRCSLPRTEQSGWFDSKTFHTARQSTDRLGVGDVLAARVAASGRCA